MPLKEFGLSEALLDQVSSSYSLQLAGEGSVESVRVQLVDKITAALKEYVQEHPVPVVCGDAAAAGVEGGAAEVVVAAVELVAVTAMDES